jgi:hypothetical protein
MTFSEACQSCREGNFLSHTSFDNEQSMHEYRGVLYYEDGAILTNHVDWIDNQDWAKEGWYIKYNKELINKDILKEMHRKNERFLSSDIGYAKCIIK